MTKSKKKKLHRWTPAEEAWLASIYATSSTKEIARRCGRTESAIMAKAHKMGIRKQVIERVNLFEKGHRTWNKGLAGYSPKGSRPYKFQNGHIPHNAKPPGIYICTEHAKPMKMIKLEGERSLKPLHRHLYEQHVGPIPAGHVIAFRNGDQLDCRIENLECITRAELMLRNQAKADRSTISRRQWRKRKGRTIVDDVLMSNI